MFRALRAVYIHIIVRAIIISICTLRICSTTSMLQIHSIHRPASAPALPQDQDGDETDGPVQSSNPRVLKSYTLGKSTASPFYGATRSSPPQKRASKAKPRGRVCGKIIMSIMYNILYVVHLQSRTVPKLPPIPKTGLVQRPSSFVFPTQNDLRKQHFERDKQVYDHVPSNPQCTCELCQMNASVVGPNTQGRETGQSGLSGFQSDIDPREMIMARQLKTGQRVVIRMKKSEYDFEPQQLTGIVKYVGKIDSEYIDNRIYVGVKLDEAGTVLCACMCACACVCKLIVLKNPLIYMHPCTRLSIRYVLYSW